MKDLKDLKDLPEQAIKYDIQSVHVVNLSLGWKDSDFNLFFYKSSKKVLRMFLTQLWERFINALC